ncbi:cytochrome c-type biogenesis protein [Sphingomonas sp. LT1P40]|uniref:cytochrome c-type biogenesis protein n=1 Tax=Alteristakelama amylovorans TaxID=3096166 RepID=UPI002FC8DB32
MSLLFALALAAAAPADLGYSQLPDAAQEAEAAELMMTLRCLVCQGQSIADSDVDMAADMRRVVRQKIAAGEKPDAVRDWLIERYGSYVTYDPPLSWATAPLWLTPFLLLAAGLLLARGTLKRRKR